MSLFVLKNTNTYTPDGFVTFSDKIYFQKLRKVLLIFLFKNSNIPVDF